MNQTLPPEQDVDQLLGSFFKSEMPHPWPACRATSRRTTLPRPAASRRRPALGSRLALALSVAALLACGWLLSGSFRAPNAGPGFNPTRPDAKRDKDGHHGVPMPDAPPEIDFKLHLDR